MLVLFSLLVSSIALADGGFSYVPHQGDFNFESGVATDRDGGFGIAGGFEIESGDLERPDLTMVRLRGSSLGTFSADVQIRPIGNDTVDFELNPLFFRITPVAARSAGVLLFLTSGAISDDGIRIKQQNGSSTSLHFRLLQSFHDMKNDAHSMAGENSIVVSTKQKLPLGITLEAEASAALITWLSGKEVSQEGLGRYLAGNLSIRKNIGDNFYLRSEITADDLKYHDKLVDADRSEKSITGMAVLGFNFDAQSKEFKEKKRAEAEAAAAK